MGNFVTINASGVGGIHTIVVAWIPVLVIRNLCIINRLSSLSWWGKRAGCHGYSGSRDDRIDCLARHWSNVMREQQDVN